VPLVDHEGEIVRRQEIMGYGSACYPGGTEFTAASPMAVGSGQLAELEITMQREPFYPVSIRVPNQPRSQGSAVEILDQTGRSLNFPVRWNAERGVADTELPNGNYIADFQSVGTVAAYGRLEFRVAGRPLLALQAAMRPVPPIAVHIRDERAVRRGEPLPDDVRRVIEGPVEEVDVTPVNLVLYSAGQIDQSGQSGNLQHRGASPGGSYWLDQVTPGRYWVQAFGQDSYVSSMTSGGNNLAVEPLVVGPESSTAPIEITLRNDWGAIHCTVDSETARTEAATSETNGGTATGVRDGAANGRRTGEMPVFYAYAIPLVRTANAIPELSTQGNEELNFQRVPPGQYRVVVFDARQQFNLDDVKAMARLEANGKTVTVEAGVAVNAQLDLTRTRDKEAAQ
jgi:hypothetical protein